jgi:hypothetical protein
MPNFGGPVRPHVSDTERALKESVLDAVARRVCERRMKPVDIQKRLPSFRQIAHSAIIQGDYNLFSLTRALSIAEAVGVKVKIEVE